MFKVKSYYTSLKGLRDANEDAHSILNNKTNYFWGVYDGHGGAKVSAYLEKNMGIEFMKNIHKDGYKSQEIKDVFDNIQKRLISDSKKDNFNIQDVGSTCLIAILTDNKLQIANSGDCRAVLCQDKGLARALTIDHKPDWMMEKNRIEQLGGRIKLDKEDDVYRIMDLSVSRAFGDIEYSAYVKHVPDVFTYRIRSSDQFLILACDGLWDVLSSQDAVNYVLTHKDSSQNIAHSLGQYAINKMGSQDNVSIIIVFFDKVGKKTSIKKQLKKSIKKSKPALVVGPKKSIKNK